MKVIHYVRKLAFLGTALLLSLCMLFIMCACHGNEGSPADTSALTDGATDSSASTDPSEGTEGETHAVSQPTEIVFKSGEGCVVYSDYAAAWEEDAAHELATLFGMKEAVLEADAKETAYTVHVGYTAYGKTYADTLATVGDLGYILAVKDGKALLLSNTEAGIRAAIDTLKANLTEIEGSYRHPDGYENICVKSSEKQEVLVEEGDWAQQLAYAKSLENGVYTEFTDPKRTQWTLANQNVILNYDMNSLHAYASITNTEGIPYVINTGYAYLMNEEGKLFTTRDSSHGERTNTYQLGYYYYNAHIMDAGFVGRVRNNPLANMRIDRIHHMYSDKLNLVGHLVASGGDITGMTAYGQYYELAADRVLAVLVKDANGYHDSIEGVDWNTAEYVGFDIERAGIFGVILVNSESSGKLIVTLTDGVYKIDQQIATDPATTHAKNTHFYFGHRLYTDSTHSFDTFKNEAECERNPLESLSIFKAESGAAYIGYDALRGAYRFDVGGTGFNEAYYQAQNKYYSVNASLQGDELNRKLYIYTHTSSGCLENAVMLDKEQNILPIALEVGKNFTGENEESTYDPGDVSYGEVYFPMTLAAGETKEFSIVNLYQKWGDFPIKQLSSIQFTSPYYHLSLGVTETNCIAPTFVYGKDHWLLPDFRSMSAPLWGGQPQHTAVGGLNVMDFTDTEGNHSDLENSTDHIDSYGPIYADVTLDYTAVDDRLEATYRHVEMPHTDENRTYYSISIRINEDITLEEFRENFYIFRFHSRLWHFSKLGYLDENNQHQLLDCTKEEGNRYLKLGTEAPYYEYHDCSDPNNNDYVNFALIIKDWDIVIGGEAYTGNFVVRDFYYDNRNFGDLTLDLGDVTLKAGDYINLDIILLPWGSQESVDNSNVLNVREDAVLNPYTLSVKTGTEMLDTYVPKVLVDDDSSKAEFTISGGTNNAVVRVYGLFDYKKPLIQEYKNGQWVDYDTTVYPYDGYMVYNDGDGTYSVAFCVDMTDASEEGRTFRVIG